MTERTRIQLHEFPGRVRQMHRLMMRRLAIGIQRRLIFLTPVDTGWARMHWILTWNRKDTERPGNPPPEAGPFTYGSPSPNTEIPPYFPTGTIQNRVPYIKKLNEGYSTKQAALFVEGAVDAEFAVLRRGRRRGPYVS